MEKYKLKEDNFDKDKLKVQIRKYLKRYSLKDVVSLISEKNNLPKNKIYKLCLETKK